jgi:hypothetical protein
MIQKEFEKVDESLDQAKLQETRSGVDVLEHKIDRIKKSLIKEELLVYNHRIEEIKKAIPVKEDSLVALAIGILHSQGVDATLQFSQNDLRAHGVSDKKLSSLEKRIMKEAPGIQQEQERDQIAKAIKMLESGSTPDSSVTPYILKTAQFILKTRTDSLRRVQGVRKSGEMEDQERAEIARSIKEQREAQTAQIQRLENQKREVKAAEQQRLADEQNEAKAAEQRRLENEQNEAKAAEKKLLESQQREAKAAEQRRLENEQNEAKAAEKKLLESQQREAKAAEQRHLENEQNEAKAAEKKLLESQQREAKAAEQHRLADEQLETRTALQPPAVEQSDTKTTEQRLMELYSGSADPLSEEKPKDGMSMRREEKVFPRTGLEEKKSISDDNLSRVKNSSKTPSKLQSFDKKSEPMHEQTSAKPLQGENDVLSLKDAVQRELATSRSLTVDHQVSQPVQDQKQTSKVALQLPEEKQIARQQSKVLQNDNATTQADSKPPLSDRQLQEEKMNKQQASVTPSQRQEEKYVAAQQPTPPRKNAGEFNNKQQDAQEKVMEIYSLMESNHGREALEKFKESRQFIAQYVDVQVFNILERNLIQNVMEAQPIDSPKTKGNLVSDASLSSRGNTSSPQQERLDRIDGFLRDNKIDAAYSEFKRNENQLKNFMPKNEFKQYKRMIEDAYKTRHP